MGIVGALTVGKAAGRLPVFGGGTPTPTPGVSPATPLFSENLSAYAANILIADGSDPHIAQPFTPISSTANLATLYWKRQRTDGAGVVTFGTTTPTAAGAADTSGIANSLGSQFLGWPLGSANHWMEYERAAASMDTFVGFAATNDADALALHVNDFGMQVYQIASGASTQILSSGPSSTSRQAWARAPKIGDVFRATSYATKAYVQRNGVNYSAAGVSHARTGTYAGPGTALDGLRRTKNPKADAAPGRLAITNDGTYANANNWRFYARKKDITGTYPKGYRDITFTGTYEGFSGGMTLQWALFDPGTDAQLTAWADPSSSTIGSGAWSVVARVPAGVETTLLGADRRTGYPYSLVTSDGRTIGAGQLPYSIGFRAIVSNKDSGIWIRSRHYFAVAANIVLTGQSNGYNQQNNSSVNVPDYPGVGQYNAAYTPNTITPLYGQINTGWDTSTTEQSAGGFDKCSGWYQLIADALTVPVMTTNVCVSATGAATHNPANTGYAADWIRSGLQQVGFFEAMLIFQGENEINTATTVEALLWRAQWRDTNIPNQKVYANQPVGVSIPVGVVLTGKYTTAPTYTPLEPSPATVLRREQELLAATTGYFLAGHPVGLTLADAVHFDGADTGYPAYVRRAALSMIKNLTGTGYDGLGPLFSTASRSGATITLPLTLNGAASLTSSTGTLTGLTGWQVNSSVDFSGTASTVSAAVLDTTANTVTLTLSADPGAPVYVRNYSGANNDDSNRVVGNYAVAIIGTIHAKPIVTAILTSS